VHKVYNFVIKKKKKASLIILFCFFSFFFLFQVWDQKNLQCIMTLNGHDDVIKSLMCWNQYLLSCN
jgi:hypothetical protein